MIIEYLNNVGQPEPYGSVIRITDSRPSGNIYEYKVAQMIVDFSGEIAIKGFVKVITSELTFEVLDTFELKVNNTSYRNMVDFTVHHADTALNPDGTLIAGYIGEFDLFVSMFGHNVSNKPNSIYPFIVDAIQRKFNLT